MDEAWERAVEAALGGLTNSSSTAPPPRSLTLDGSVKCLHGRLPPPEILERYQSLEHLSIANVGVSSLEKFPRLRNLQRLILSDNRIAGGLEFLVEAGLESLRDLDLSNNRIQFLEDLAPLAQLRLVSLDLYECPVTRIKDYRSRVFGMIRTLRYLDKMDADENERPESDDEEDEEDEEDEDEEEDPGSGEVDGDDRAGKLMNGVGTGGVGGIVDVYEEEESDAEEETETARRIDANGGERRYNACNGFRVAPVMAVDGGEDEEEEDDDIEDDDEDEDIEDDLGEEIDAEERDEDDVVEVHDVGDSEEEVDGVEEEGEEEVDDEDEDGDGDEDQEDVEDEEDDGEPESSGRLMSAEGEIDGHEQGEGDEDENGEIGEEDEQGVNEDRYSAEGDDDGEDEDEDDDNDGEYLVQPIAQPATARVDFDACNQEDEDEVDDDEDDLHSNIALQQQPSSASNPNKRRRGEEDDLDDDSVEDLRRSKHP
ncbi:acidic leucine-rich nuclear phosphoprotein 32-related protein 1-like [Musa acuminata AAA Group]|uniref:acidic leucine-rich nuclear phosphoprotein 32-related protein 1-like n=1 Tax=Musa acuminata AAA Group TaxID=214697 RepID=UPI0031DB8926